MATLEDILAKSIPELKQRYVDRARPVPKGLIEALECDSRQGAHQVAKQIRERWRKNRAEGQRLHNLLRFEIDLWGQGFNFIAGVDEAGTGMLAKVLGFTTTIGVTLAIVRKARDIFWMSVGVTLMVRRGLSLRAAADQGEEVVT